MKATVILITLFLWVGNSIGQGVLINEFMSKNNNTISDGDGDYSDWIELYNTSNMAVDLLGYKLSDDGSDLNKWTFPELTIGPHTYLLIFASGKNKFDISELHTNFKISSGGEELFLTNALGAVVDQTAPVSLPPDMSYARLPDGSSNWVVVANTSPNASNNNSNQLSFSHQEGFYTTPFTLKIDAFLSDTIRYTLNGDRPTGGSAVFADSLLIDYRTPQANTISEIPTSPAQGFIDYKAWEPPDGLVDKANVFRCASFKNGVRTSRIYTKTFFVDNGITGKYTVPVISLVTGADNLFSPDSGIYVPGVHYNSNNPQWTGNYFMHGQNWEREVHIECFTSDGILCFEQDAGLRVHGGKTRQASQKSLRLYARKEYGTKYFNYQLFPQRQLDKYKRFILRTSMGAWGGQTVIKDALAQNISSTLDIDYQEFQAAVVFINGEYWGIHTIRDRIDERFIGYIHNIDKDSVEFREKDNADYNSLMDFIQINDLSFDDNFEYVKTQIDLGNYIDYTIAELFFSNYDWPANNTKLWRKKPHGKWRWVLFDLDAAYGDPDYNMFTHATLLDSSVTWPNSPASTLLFRSLLKNGTFRSQFVDKYAEILNGVFQTETMRTKLDSVKGIYRNEIPANIKRWNYPASMERWEEDIENDLLLFIEQRPCAVKDHIMEFFELSDFNFDCNTYNDSIENSNELILAPNPNTGNFFLLAPSLDIVNATVLISNINGQIVYKENNVSFVRNERKYFNLSFLPGNTYVLQIVSGSFSQQKKIVIIN